MNQEDFDPVLYNAKGQDAGASLRHVPASAVEEPQDQRKHDADQDACDNRGIEGEFLTFDHDIPWQPPEPDAREPWPQNAQSDEHESQDDQSPCHMEIVGTG